jgi:hypothetical protein
LCVRALRMMMASFKGEGTANMYGGALNASQASGRIPPSSL